MPANPLLSSLSRDMLIRRLYELYPKLSDDTSTDWQAILDNAHILNLPAGAVLAAAGSACTDFMLLLDGTVRIYQDTEKGREMTLYHIAPGGTCFMGLNSLIHDRPFLANASAETDVSLILFKAEDFQEGMRVSNAFRMLILSSLADTVCTIIQNFYTTVFEPLDMRLVCILGQLFERRRTEALDITHQELSQELGTTREVVSRLLKKLEQQHCIVLKRGKIIAGKNRKMLGTTQATKVNYVPKHPLFP